MTDPEEFHPYFMDWEPGSVEQINREQRIVGREAREFAWECAYCKVLNATTEVRACTACGASREHARLRAIWSSE